MSLKDKMMDSMMGNMSKDEKLEMMDKMMNQFFSSMTDEEKKEMMHEMMPKMMQQMMGGGGMMGRMGKRTGSEDGCCEDSGNEAAGFNPMDMCKEMVGSIRNGYKVATLATPEIQGLFEDWVEQIEGELNDYLPQKKNADIQEIATHFKISEKSAYYFVTRLAQKGKIHIQAVKA